MPLTSVTETCVPIIEGLVAVTVTPGSTPPLLSATLPLIEPVELAPPPWANAVDVNKQTAITATNSWNPRLMNFLLVSELRRAQWSNGVRFSQRLFDVEYANAVLDIGAESVTPNSQRCNDLGSIGEYKKRHAG